MLQIDVPCHEPDEEHPHAPILDGLLHLRGEEENVAFILDTGAEWTSVHPDVFHPPKHIFKQGSKTTINGVVGDWPARTFEDEAVFSVLAQEPDTGEEVLVDIPIPHLSILVPCLEQRGDRWVDLYDSVNPQDPRVQEGTMDLPRPCWPLLGRDVLFHNEISFRYDPNEDSYLRFESPTAELEAE